MLDGNFQMGEYQKASNGACRDEIAGRSLVNGRSYIPQQDTLQEFLLKMPDSDEVRQISTTNYMFLSLHHLEISLQFPESCE